MSSDSMTSDITGKAREILAKRWGTGNAKATPLKAKQKKILAQFFRVKSKLLSQLGNGKLKSRHVCF